MPKPPPKKKKKQKKNLHPNICSKSNTCIPNATTPTLHPTLKLIIRKYILDFFFLKLTTCLTLVRKYKKLN